MRFIKAVFNSQFEQLLRQRVSCRHRVYHQKEGQSVSCLSGSIDIFGRG